ncbi:MFS transporter [Acidianus ambivalens]|uniref:MFS transporter n=1 Tax=Acidianus ambivalens TaxID=2283 RepID=A0A650CW05_ACIAM|nr:MFS transporter [Acidianus ambivalens]MQL56517.1 MFS transporter [Acidianus ambivalens]QGR21958.1 MFS transporter [Acidianus ambivalens]
MKNDMGFKYLVFSRIFRSIGIIYITLVSPLYLKFIGFSLVSIGIIFLFIILFNTVLVFALGLLGDRIGYKRTLIIGDLFPFLSAILLFSSSSKAIIISSLLMGGLGGTAGGMRGVFSPGLTALVASNWKNDFERVKRLGILTSAAAFSSIGGSLLLSIKAFLPFSLELKFRFLFLISAMLLGLSILSLFRVYEVTRPKKNSKIMRLSSLKYSGKVMLSNSLSGAGVGLALPLLPLWFELMYRMSSYYIGIIYSISYLATALGSFFASNLSKWINILDIASWTRILSGILLVFIPFSSPLIGSFIYILRSLIAGFGSPSRSTVNMKGVSTEDFGAASSIQGIASRTSQATAGASGYLMEIYPPMPLIVGGILQAISGWIYLKMLKQ